jgi:hypothetical protein
MTNISGILQRAVMMLSQIPSAIYSCPGSPLMFTKGSTAIEGLSGSGYATDAYDWYG